MQKENQITYYLDRESYNQLLTEIESLKEELRKLNLERGEVHKQGTDIAWDDNEFVCLEETINIIKNEIKIRKKIISFAIILEPQNNDEIIDVGDTLRLNIIYSENDYEEIIGKLVGIASDVNINENYEEISINSPIGVAIYGKTIGEKIPYKVNGKTNYVEVIEKVNLEKQKPKTKVKQPKE